MPPTAQPLRRQTNYSRYSQPMQATAPKPIVKVPSPKAPAALKITGDPDLWQTLQRVTDPTTGWTKTTRAMSVPDVRRSALRAPSSELLMRPV